MIRITKQEHQKLAHENQRIYSKINKATSTTVATTAWSTATTKTAIKIAVTTTTKQLRQHNQPIRNTKAAYTHAMKMTIPIRIIIKIMMVVATVMNGNVLVEKKETWNQIS